MTIQIPGDELVPDEELAEEWETSRRTLGRYDRLPDGLPFVYVAGRKYRPLNASRVWLANRIGTGALFDEVLFGWLYGLCSPPNATGRLARNGLPRPRSAGASQTMCLNWTCNRRFDSATNPAFTFC